MPKLDLIFAATDSVNAQQAVVVVIDVFRATSTMVTALHNGCSQIIPVARLSEALSTAARLKNVRLAGERQTQKPAHFDFGNSPLEFTSSAVAGKTIVLTTTNGTKALRSIHNASAVLLAAFLNIEAVAHHLQQQTRDVLFYCAGNNGRFSLEDTLCATWLIDQLLQSGNNWQPTDVVQWAWQSWSAFPKGNSKQQLLAWAAKSEHAQKLKNNHLQADVDFCLQWAIFSEIPILDGRTQVVQLLSASS